MELDLQQINDCQSLFVTVVGFYPHHVGYEIHSLCLEGLGDQDTVGPGVHGSHTLNLEGKTLATEGGDQPCNITITDIYTHGINYDPHDDHAYIGSVRLNSKSRITATVNVRPSIMRDVLNFFYYRPADDHYQLKREVIVRLDISIDPYGEEYNQRYNIIRIAFE